MFKALQVNRGDDKSVTTGIVELNDSDLPEGDVTVKVEYSALNYKDGLVLNGLGGLVRQYPHVPGIDFAGVVESSNHANYKPGDNVVLTGWRVGEVHWGGYAQKARVKGDWLVPLPKGLSTRQAMAIGTAGFSAMLGVMTLESAGITPDSGPILVTGAAGGVGSVACSLLAQAGYTVEGSTGRATTEEYLKGLGVSRIVARSDLDTPNGKPLNKEYWAGCIDTVGGSTLANVLTQLKYRGAVAAIGLAGGSTLDTTVIPFLLRGVSLLGVDSVMCPSDIRLDAWNRIAKDLPTDQLNTISSEVSLLEAATLGKDILEGKVQGRVLVNVNA